MELDAPQQLLFLSLTLFIYAQYVIPLDCGRSPAAEPVGVDGGGAARSNCQDSNVGTVGLWYFEARILGSPYDYL